MRYLLYSAALAATLTATLVANQSLDSRIGLLEEQMKDLRVETANGNFGANTASAYPSLNSWGGYASVEGLYMKFTEGGLDYAFTENAGNSASYQGTLEYLDFDWRFAFRVTAGYQVENSNWDTWAEYMRFATTQKSSTTPPPGGSIDSNIYQPNNTQYQYAEMKMQVSFNVVDWNTGCNYFLRKNFSLHPFAGIRGSWINQHQNTPLNTTTRSFDFWQKNDSWSVGLRSGTQIRWHLSKNWSVFGSAAGAILYTQFSNQAKLSQTVSGIDIEILNLNLGDRRLLPNTTLDAGFSWEMPFFRDRSRVRLSAGYEFNYWWRQNQTIHLNALTNYSYFTWSEDLALQGVKLNAAFDF